MQISLVWNARDEDSVQDDKLRKMAEVPHLTSFLSTRVAVLTASSFTHHTLSCPHHLLKLMACVVMLMIADPMEKGQLKHCHSYSTRGVG